MGLAKISEAIEDIKAGKFIIIVDDAARENEGDLAIAAEKVSTEAINFMATHGRYGYARQGLDLPARYRQAPG